MNVTVPHQPRSVPFAGKQLRNGSWRGQVMSEPLLSKTLTDMHTHFVWVLGELAGQNVNLTGQI